MRYGLTARAGPRAPDPQFAGAQNTQIRAASVLIEIQPTSPQNGGYLNAVLRIPITLRDKLTVLARRRGTADR